MYFKANFGFFDEHYDEASFRQTVKGIAVRDGKILMIKSKRGDYTFPGGRLEEGESREDGLRREMKEETGYDCRNIHGYIGKTLLRKVDKYDRDKMYELASFYYICEVSKNQGRQTLCENEQRRDLKPEWIRLQDVIANNARFLFNDENVEYWLEQVNYVIPRIHEYYRK